MTARDTSGSRSTTPTRDLVGAQVLVIDGDPRIHRGVTDLLRAASLHVTCAADPETGLAELSRHFYSVVLIDLDTPTPGAGVDVIRQVHAASPTSMILGLTPRRSFEDAVAAVRAGAIDLVLKAPDSVAYLKDRVLDAAARSVGRREVESVLTDVRSAHEEFLARFMDAERRALDAGDRLAGKDPGRSLEIDLFTVLVVDEVDSLVDELRQVVPAGFQFLQAMSGGEALDRISTHKFHFVLISDELSDLPASMVIQTVRSQSPESVGLVFRGPGPGGYVNLVETAGQRTVVQPFTEAHELATRLDELAEGFRAKTRERRYTQNFREKHYDFLRRYVDIKLKVDRALSTD